MKTLLLDPFSGISGDMFLGALVDLGCPLDVIQRATTEIPALAKVKITSETVQRGAFKATRVVVACPHEHAHRGLSAIREMIEASSLPYEVKNGAVATFTVLAKAEAKVHGVDIEKIHFHEVGALDAIADIVGAHLALLWLGATKVVTRPLALGTGTTKSAHGEIPLPSPATVEILSGFPTTFTDRKEELVTPTGAAIVASIAEPLTADQFFTPDSVGYGAGSREGEGMPNVLRAVVGSVASRPAYVCVVKTTIDDMNPELYESVTGGLFEAGALDVYLTSVMMKKNRPGIELTLICDEARMSDLCDVLFSLTTTLGVRISREDRLELSRRAGTVDTEFGTVAVKIADRPGGSVTMSPEYESCRRIAEETGVSLAAVYEAARIAWRDGSSER